MNHYIFIAMMAFLLFDTGRLSGQQNVSDLYLHSGTDDFAIIQNSMNQHFNDNNKGKGSGYKQWKRWEYLAERRLTPDGKVANWAARNFDAYQEYTQAQTNSDNGEPTDVAYGHWQSLGPFNYPFGTSTGGMGRVNCIAFHPTLQNTFWVGAPSGGLWKTTDGGVTWIPLTDGMPCIGVSGIAIDYTNTNIIYILTGDGDAGDTPSIGVLKSVDGGDTWQSTGLTFTASINVLGYKLLIHPTDHLILLVASDDGIYKTSNGGESWTQVHSGFFKDMEFKPGDPTIVYASGYNTQFWRSADTASHWTRITIGVPTSADRMAIGVSPDDPNSVYLLAGPSTGPGTYVGTYLSSNSGLTFLTRSTSPNILGFHALGNDFGDQATYDLAIAVSRTDISEVMSGGVNTWRSQNHGTTWNITSHWTNWALGYTHADIHGLEINPLNNWLYCVSDGGVYRSKNFGNTWTDISEGLAITQFYRIDGVEGIPNLITGGSQDNGSFKWTGGTSMEAILGGDGMDCMIDYNDNSVLYNMVQDGLLYKSINGGTSFDSIQPAGSTGSWVTPIVMDPSNSNIIYAGYSDVFKSTNGGGYWLNMGVDGRGAMAIGSNNPDRIYASNEAVINMSDDKGLSWTEISAGLPGIEITFIAVDPDISNNVFITLAGYTSGEKVYESIDAGANWTNITGNLPNVPVNCIAYEDNDSAPEDAIYIGTDIGVFYRDDNHTDWIPFRNGLPTVPVFDIEINKASGVLTAATYGRGLWRSNLYSACNPSLTLTVANDPSNPNYTGYQFNEASHDVHSSRTITGGLGTDVTYQSGNYIKLTTGFQAKEHNSFKAKLAPCSLAVPVTNTLIKVPGTYVENDNQSHKNTH